MSLRIYVDAYSGYKANERPVRFELDDQVYQIAAIEDRWQDPNAEFFKVRTEDGKRYLLRYDSQEDAWTLQSGFDGGGLLSRPNIELIAVGEAIIVEAESQIAGCEQCRGNEADIPFDWLLADILEKRRACEFAMSRPAACPHCGAPVTEKTLVEPQGGIEVETR